MQNISVSNLLNASASRGNYIVIASRECNCRIGEQSRFNLQRSLEQLKELKYIHWNHDSKGQWIQYELCSTEQAQ